MLEKRVTAILYGSDRNLWAGGPLDLRVTDLFAARGPRVLYQGDVEDATVDLTLDLPFDANQLYGITFARAAPSAGLAVPAAARLHPERRIRSNRTI